MKNNMLDIDEATLKKESETSDGIVYYSSKFDEYGIPIRDGEKGKASSYILIDYCPWCGKKLPQSKRNEWFEKLEKMGFSSPMEENIPQKFKTSEWWDYGTRGRSCCLLDPRTD